MANIPEKIMKQRLRLQLQSLDSPSELPGSYRSSPDLGVSPMTDLAINLHSSKLSLTPSPAVDSKRRLSLDSSSSESPPERNALDSSCTSNDSPAPMARADSTPLSSITNKPSRTKLGFGRLTSLKPLLRDVSPGNKENLLPGQGVVFSPAKARTGLFSPGKSPRLCLTKSPSLNSSSPCKRLREQEDGAGGMRRSRSLQGQEPRRSVKRPMFSVLEEEENSVDSGYSSQHLELPGDRSSKRSREEHEKSRDEEQESLNDMLKDCSPGKEEGFAALPESPEAKQEEQEDGDGFNVMALARVEEEEETTIGSTKMLTKMSFLDNQFMAPRISVHPPPPPDSLPPSDLALLSSLPERRPTLPAPGRPQFRRALSMLEPSSAAASCSPLSSFQLGKLGFKRPEPPRETVPSLLGLKKRRLGVVEPPNPRELLRSHSASELSIMKSCEVKEEVVDILPDSSRLYALPSISAGSKHPSLRSITCDTMAEVMQGHHASTIRSFRIVDVRYKFEFEGGHIRGAENWQHGEDEEFLSSFMPNTPLAEAPPSYNPLTTGCGDRRDILVFHCEFSSQRGPDFYKKLRERDRQLNKDVYPGLHFPECYLLHLGYKEFWRGYPELCDGGYTEMIDQRHESDLRRMRAKSKSWSGGTVARTSRLGRLNL